jgi:hypothetical protein
MQRRSSLTDERLESLYNADGFGGEKTMRANAIRELIDEIRSLRSQLPPSDGHAPRLPRESRHGGHPSAGVDR